MAEESKPIENAPQDKGSGDKPAAQLTTGPDAHSPATDDPAPVPDPNVVAPKMELITHGADESKVTKVILGSADKLGDSSTSKDSGKIEK